jgi:hypothetical protein
MQPITLNWNTGSATAIANAQKVAAHQLLQLNNDASLPPGYIGHVTVNPGFVRQVSVSSTTTDLSGGTVTINGMDFNNNPLSITMPGPGVAATVYTTAGGATPNTTPLLFKVVTSVTSSLAAEDISVGTDLMTTATENLGQSSYLLLDWNLPSFSASYSVNITAATISYDVLVCLERPYLINQNHGTVSVNPNINPYLLVNDSEVDSAGSLTMNNASSVDPNQIRYFNSPLTFVYFALGNATTSTGSATFTVLQQGVTSA